MDGSFGKNFEKKVRKLWHRVSPQDPANQYQRRLTRGVSEVSQAFDGKDKIVLVHTYGKVGSTAIHKAIDKLPGFASFQTHVLSESGVADAQSSHPGRPAEIHTMVGEAFRGALQSHPETHVRVITLVRDPVARAVSDLFENPDYFVNQGDLSEMPLAKLVDLAVELVPKGLAVSEQWFDHELGGLLGFDLFARDFDRMKGFEIFREGRFELLAGKLERLSDDGAGILGRFLDIGGDFPISKTRARSGTTTGLLYEQVRQNLKLPAKVLDEVYSSRMCRHFYTPEELERFWKRWVQP